jgi:hypothetical protein
MSGKVRVFVSSTMEDLVNERRAVFAQIEDLELIPVNAEGLLPNGASSWSLLKHEIETSNIFILILGDRYGWIPKTGPGAGQDKSVTHLEVEVARAAGIPILPYFKGLKYETRSLSHDAKRRDAFRREISDWESGHFRTMFEFADELGLKVRKGLQSMFLDSFLKEAVRKTAPIDANPDTIPPSLPAIVRKANLDTRGVLLAGAGLSVSAGYPTASSMAEVLGERLGIGMSGSEMLARHSFAEIASFAEQKLERRGLLQVVEGLLDPPLPVSPTKSHILAVQCFSTILTTNYDSLFERACVLLGKDYCIVTPQRPMPERRGITIYKIDGSANDPDTLVLTHDDVRRAQDAAPFWNELNDLMGTHDVTVIGHSVRDRTSQMLLAQRDKKRPGFFVNPYLDELDELRVSTYGLTGIKQPADEFLEDLFAKQTEIEATPRV